MLHTIRNNYQTYKEYSDNPVSIKEYLEIVNGFMKFIVKKVLNGEVVYLPYKVGHIFIDGKKVKPRFDENGKPTNLKIDYHATKQLRAKDPIAEKEKKVVYHLNSHSNNIRYKIRWYKAGVFIENKTLYQMVFTRENKRAISKKVFNENKRY